ncbi:MAG TPA: hypothetical protein VKW76_08580 [Candidatus Binatia bacterium]|nr:hypothetical protein [Candidatus Binatia bacterium]
MRATDAVGTALLLEHDRVRVWDFVLAPGEAFPMHTHRLDHVIVVLEGGRLETTDATGRRRTVEPKAGDWFWCAVDGEDTHDARNVGSTRYRNLVVEIKR